MKRLLVLLVLVLAAVSLAQKAGGILRAGMQTDPVGLDPHTTNATASRNVLENIYDTLVMLDSKGRIVPGLAQSWSVSPDGLTWTFRLRPGVIFHNGDPLKASDVVFSINRIKDPATKSPRANDFALVRSVTAPNNNTVVITLSQPFSPLLAKLAFSTNAIVSEKVAKEHNNDLNKAVIGTGPFRFVEYIPQTRLVVRKWDKYWQKGNQGRPLPYLDGITYTFYPDPAARSTALRAGAVDWIEYVTAADVRPLKADRNLVVVGGPSANFRALYFNTTREPYNNPKVRQAIAYAIDKKAIVDLALFGTGGIVARGTTIPSGAYAYTNSPYNTRDVAKAKQLLAEAGLPNGFTMNLYVTSTYDFLRTPADVIRDNLAEIGIRVNIQAEDWNVYLPKALRSEFDVTLLGTSGQADPDDYLFNTFHPSSALNLSKYKNDRVTQLLEQGRRVSSQSERQRIYTQVQELVLQDSPMVFLFHSAQYEAMNRRVQGFLHFPNTSYLAFRYTWLQ
ncbi:ABC transporter substrate-binding protein [Meiothermus ruber]|uniref:ABC transporter substrate-binding protein n=1 Tax=Meiothermus ruber TaxID=277 RepID=UPI00056482F8|nr:ABC transporter substrate-binding protein [Meiothermus ruber]MCL6531167.1 ABC transporter substrate-binding protein [Meiothermus ruber]